MLVHASQKAHGRKDDADSGAPLTNRSDSDLRVKKPAEGGSTSSPCHLGHEHINYRVLSRTYFLDEMARRDVFPLKRPWTNIRLTVLNCEWLAVIQPRNLPPALPKSSTELEKDDVMRESQGSIRQLDYRPDADIGKRETLNTFHAARKALPCLGLALPIE